MNFTAKIAEVDGLPVHYQEAGNGETIVYLHAAGGRIIPIDAGRKPSASVAVAARLR